MGWGYDQIFTGRAMMLHLGDFTATIMTANVFFVIMPNQRIVVKDFQEGRTPDAKYGRIAKLRSTHNTCLTLPVLFLMLSNHYPLAFATQGAWIIASLVFLSGETIRHHLNTRHATGKAPIWSWGATAVIFVVMVALSAVPGMDSAEQSEARARALTLQEQKFASAATFEDAYHAVTGNCSICHAREPDRDGIVAPPKGMVLETEADVARHAKAVYLQAGASHAMPPPNALGMDPEARDQIVAWYRDVAG